MPSIGECPILLDMTTTTDVSLSAPLSDSASPPDLHEAPAIELVLPVFNEEQIIDSSVRALHEYMACHFACSTLITIADNASTDSTLERAELLAGELEGVRVLHLDVKGRGNALRTVWGASTAEVVGYMDIDLSTDLDCLPGLLRPLLENRTDLAIGSRLAPASKVTRGLKREVISRSYNILLRNLLGISISDAQCGFKAARRETLAPLLEDVQDGGWFFDTELLYLARRHRLSITEVPVRWVDDPDSRVAIIPTAMANLRGIARLRREKPRASAGEDGPATPMGRTWIGHGAHPA